jgi:RNA polymerase sigma-70 factor, ECF subfamily
MNRVRDIDELVKEARTGNQVAFQELFYQTHLLARKIAVSVVGPQNVDDAVQESYLLVFRKLPQLRDTGAFRGWLCRLVLHTCYRMQSKQKDTAELKDSQAQVTDESDTLVDSIYLRQGLMRLKKSDREILVLRELLGLSYEETAFAMNIRVGTVRSRLHAARKRLAKRLKI